MGIGQELSVVNVSKYYGSFKALEDINLVCRPGEFVSILGSSGSGKTTLLKVIAGFERCSDGRIFINGKDVATVPCFKRNIGMLFQNYALFPHLTVAQNIAYPLKLRHMKKAAIEKQVHEMIALVKLTGLEDRLPRQLSGGQQQRVALARAIVYNPPLLLLDEPLGALDKNLRHDMQFEIKRITHSLGMTTISVTHDQEEAFSMSDKICIVCSGRIQQFGTPSEIYEHPANRFVAEFMGTTNIIPMKQAKYEEKESGADVVSGITPLSDSPVRITADASAVRTHEDAPYFALRPEAIHLVSEGQSYDNTFKAQVKESIYLGQSVKSKAEAGGLELNLNLSVSEYRNLKEGESVTFGFNAADTALIYD
jgi:putative spermidine/putrescine transport system ATP-binding protein